MKATPNNYVTIDTVGNDQCDFRFQIQQGI